MRTTRDPSRSPWLIPLACLLVVGTLLGLSANLVKLAAGAGLNPLTLLTWSVVGATLLLTPINVMTGRLPRFGRRIGEYSLVSALVGVVAPNIILYAAVPEVGAGFVALTIAFPPLFTYVGALAMRLERFDSLRAAGVGLALTGAAYMAFLKASLPDAPVVWIAATLLAPVILAVGNIYRTVRWPADARPEELVPGVLVVSSLLLIGVGALTDISPGVPWDQPVAVALIAAQAAALSVQFTLFFVLQKRGGPVFLSLLGSVAAVVGVPVAVLLLGEMPPEGLVSGALLIAGGISLVVWGGARSQRTVDRLATSTAHG